MNKQLDSKLFGTDGVRGVANQHPMDSETVLKLGRALAYVLTSNASSSKKGHRAKILIGKDTRISGYMLETALETGLSSMGVDTLLLGPIPTPGVAFMIRSMRVDAGVMISASHNEYQDNGIKIFGPDGYKLDDETEELIEKLVVSDNLNQNRATSDKIGKMFRIDDAIGRYCVYLKSCLPRNISFEGLKVVLDCANGAAYKVAPLVFRELGMNVVLTGVSPDGMNINENCGSLFPQNISELTKKYNAFCGIAFDGDADRVIICDENGDVLDGDSLIALAALDYKEKGILKGDGVVGTVMSNLGLEKTLSENNLTLHRAKVGDRYVISEMRRLGMNLGGEQSGHLIYLDHNTTGDGILSALMTLSILIEKNNMVSTAQKIITKYPQILLNVAVSKKTPFEQMPKVQTALENAMAKLGNKGRVLLRYSGTENLARVMVEAQNDSVCKEIANDLAAVVNSNCK